MEANIEKMFMSTHTTSPNVRQRKGQQRQQPIELVVLQLQQQHHHASSSSPEEITTTDDHPLSSRILSNHTNHQYTLGSRCTTSLDQHQSALSSWCVLRSCMLNSIIYCILLPVGILVCCRSWQATQFPLSQSTEEMGTHPRSFRNVCNEKICPVTPIVVALETMPRRYMDVVSISLQQQQHLSSYFTLSSLVPEDRSDKTHVVPDYGGIQYNHCIKINPTQAKSRIRNINFNDTTIFQQEKELQMTNMDVIDLQGIRFARTKPSTGCIQPQWTRQQHPACNIFHEYMTTDNNDDNDIPNFFYLGSGHFRDAFRHKIWQRHNHLNGKEGEADIVLKRLRLEYYMEWTEDNLDRVRREALLMEVLSASARINTIYGFCGSSLTVQIATSIEDRIIPNLTTTNEHNYTYQTKHGYMTPDAMLAWKKKEGQDRVSLNNFTAKEKLDMALEMAESLADMVGLFKSPVVNNDIKLAQWLRTRDGQLVLNDFNYAFFLPWHAERQSYCKVYRSIGGDFRAPEELEGDYVDDKADVWSFGDVLFSLLTGLFPYFEMDPMNKAQIEQKVLDGVRPYLDPAIARNSWIESRLVEIMDRCHVLDPDERADIFDVVKHLRDTQNKYLVAEPDRTRPEL